MRIILLSFLILFIQINNQVPAGKVIHTCGKLGYDQATKKEDCVEKGEICCYVQIRHKDKTTDSDKLGFCVTSPTMIEIDDVKSEILDYTDFNVLKLECTDNSQLIKTSIKLMLMIAFILF